MSAGRPSSDARARYAAAAAQLAPATALSGCVRRGGVSRRGGGIACVRARTAGARARRDIGRARDRARPRDPEHAERRLRRHRDQHDRALSDRQLGEHRRRRRQGARNELARDAPAHRARQHRDRAECGRGEDEDHEQQPAAIAARRVGDAGNFAAGAPRYRACRAGARTRGRDEPDGYAAALCAGEKGNSQFDPVRSHRLHRRHGEEGTGDQRAVRPELPASRGRGHRPAPARPAGRAAHRSGPASQASRARRSVRRVAARRVAEARRPDVASRIRTR